MPMQGVNHALAALYDGRDLRTLPLQPGLIRNLIGEGILHPHVQQFNPIFILAVDMSRRGVPHALSSAGTLLASLNDEGAM